MTELFIILERNTKEYKYEAAAAADRQDAGARRGWRWMDNVQPAE